MVFQKIVLVLNIHTEGSQLPLGGFLSLGQKLNLLGKKKQSSVVITVVIINIGFYGGQNSCHVFNA